MIKNKQIKITFEDDCIVVVDKPAGILVIPTPKNEKYTLTSILNEDFKERGLNITLHPCHRLDRETSGIIIYAKGKKNQQKIMEQFKQHKVKKTYIAFVHGHLKTPKGVLRDYLEGKLAVTEYKILEHKPNFDIIELNPLTGRKNQIRIQFKKIGHPLVGERHFAFARDFDLKFKRTALHAQKIEFNHPKTNKHLIFKADLAKDMLGLIGK
jgi:23S rRNA pseudouridine1911/1915/1917 synthase